MHSVNERSNCYNGEYNQMVHKTSDPCCGGNVPINETKSDTELYIKTYCIGIYGVTPFDLLC